ncbi:MAG: acyl-CoA dehydrogenase family protein [Planctomycetes bacterium]|nr:acyl-CoA dehydrogenase family protein [Planctomycetota bacterium]
MDDATSAAAVPRGQFVDFVLSEGLLAIQARAREIAREVVAPNAVRYDEEACYPKEAVDALAEAGFMAMLIPPEYGGRGLGNLALCVTLLEINRVCASAGVVCSVHNSLATYPIIHHAAEAVKRKYLPKLAAAEMIGAYALTEPEAGSDAANQRTTAVRDGDHFVLHGSKIFITTGKEADLFVVFARTSKEDKPAKGISCFVVEADTPGLTVGKSEVKLGIRGSSTTEIHLEDCCVPAGHLLGELGRGFNIAMEVLNGGRIGIACQATGILGGLIDEVNAFSSNHKRQGKPLSYHQDVAWKLSEMVTDYDAACLLVYRAACARERTPNPLRECSTAKLFASQAANRHARVAVSLLGREGLKRGHRVERFYRDARITEIYEGTTEVQKIVIARTLEA